MRLLWEGLKLGFASLWAHKLRTFLTLLGHIMGVITVVTLVSLIQGLNHYVSDKILVQGANLFYVDKFGLAFSQEDFLDRSKRRDLSMDDFIAVVEAFLVDAKECHSFCLEPQDQLDLVWWHAINIGRVVEGRVGVGVPANLTDVLEMILGSEPVRAAEHHVLEHMGESLAIGLLVLRADVIPHLDRDDGTGVVLERHHGQSVV